MSKSRLIDGSGSLWALSQYLKEDFSTWKTTDLLSLLRSYYGREIEELHEKIKIELAKRPNIPTKAQAKKARQEKAYQKRNR